MEHLTDFLEGFLFASFNGTDTFRPTAVTSTGYTVASGGALPNSTLVYARGFNTAANNGLKVLAGTSTGTEIKTSGLTAEASPPSNVILEVCGVRGASGDIQVNSAGNLIATALDFTTLGLTVGQVIWVGGDAAAQTFAVAANRGYARITAIAAGVLTLDKKATTFAIDNGSGKLIDIFFGRFGRNVPVSDGDYIERSIHFEAAYDNLAANGTDTMYEYSAGNYCNSLEFDLPLAGKATLSLGFVGTDTGVPTGTRATGGSTAKAPLRTVALNTSADIARLRITEVDETGLTTDFKTLKLKINNNVSGEKVLGELGPRYLNTGNFLIDLEADLLFTNSEVIDAIRNNTTVTMDFAVRNDDGAMFVDIPSLTLSGGSREFPVNETIRVKTTAEAFQNTTLGTSIGVSLFPYVPTA
jgi:hypothetical protein